MIRGANCRRVLLALAVLLGAFLLLLPTSAQASDVLTSDDGKWSLAECEGGVEVTAYHGDAADVYVPASVAVGGVEYTVVKLADSLFENNDGLNSVTLGTSILEVGAKAFYDCDNLVCVLLSESTTTLGAEAFSGCDSFNSIILYDAITAIGDSAFADCPSLTVWCNENNTGYSYAVENSIPYQLLSTTATPEIVTLDGIVYYIMNGQAIAVSFDGSTTTVTIPATVEGHPVTELRETFRSKIYLTSVSLPSTLQVIGDYAFYKCTKIKTVEIPDTVTTIGKYAFSESGLTGIVIGGNIKAIGSYAFYLCKSLESVTLCEGIENLGDHAFYYCQKLTGITIPSTISNFGAYAFAYCSALADLSFSNGLAIIGDYAFYYCSLIRTVSIPGSVQTIGSSAFSSCSNLRYLSLSEGIQTIGGGCFYSTDIRKIYFPESYVPTDYPADSYTVVWVVITGSPAHKFVQEKDLFYVEWDGVTDPFYIHNSITYCIKDEQAIAIECEPGLVNAEVLSHVATYPVTTLRLTFRMCADLTSVVLPQTLTSIDRYTFRNCTSLADINIPETVSFIGHQAFESCTSLKAVTIAGSNTVIDNWAFENCTALESVVLKNGVSKILSGAFRKCTSLQEITFPDSLTYLENAFSYSGIKKLTIPCEFTGVTDCPNLEELVITANITYIPQMSLRGNKNLVSIVLPDTVTSIGFDAFGYDEKLKYINLPNGITSIGSGAFSNCTSLESITLPEKLTSVSGSLFEKCTALKSIAIPSGVTTISSSAFTGCSSLASVSLPDGLVSIGNNAFAGCDNLIYILIPQKTTLGTTVFPSSVVLVVYENSPCHTYAQENGHVFFIWDGVNLPEFHTADGITYCIFQGEAIALKGDSSLTTAVIAQSVAGYPVTQMRSVFQNHTGITSVTLPETLELIGEYAFYGCTSLASISIPENVTQIGNYAFHQCTALSTLSIPANVDSIGNYAFYQCSALQNVAFSEGLLSLGISAFEGCSSLTSLVLPESLTTLGAGAFCGCSQLKEAHITCNVGDYAFSGCKALSTATMTDDVTAIGDAAFTYCPFSNLTLSQNLTTIGDSAFRACRFPAKLVLPDSLTYIGPRAFYHSYPKEIVIPSGITTIEEYTFSYCHANKITLPEGLTTIEGCAFYYSPSLYEINIPSTVTYIGESAFKECYGLSHVEIPAGVDIANNAFHTCPRLSSVIIPEGAESIGSQAFYNCNLLTVLIPKSIQAIASDSFDPGVIALVYNNSYAHSFAVENNLLYFVLRETENPEIAYGAGISGTVVYSGGSPAAGVSVEILYDDGISKETVTTDETGAYSFTYAEVGAYTIRATDASGSTASTAAAVKRMNVFDVFLAGDTDLTLKQGWTVSGTVSESAATVTLTDESGNVLGTAQTTDGSFAFTNIPNGTYILKAETETGSAVQEITVFDGAVSDITLTVSTQSATVWGYVEVEDRTYKHHRRNWVQVTLYNADGTAVSQCKSDTDGAYRFAGLPLGQYTIVAETAEMRPDKKHGFDRSFTLTGYAYVDAAEAKEYQADTIILYEENDYLSSISGKVTANGETQVCEVILRNVFRQEVARCATKNNGKYTFQNVRDGLYIVTATTGSNGMGYTVVAVRHGRVYGETDIKILKADKIKNREDKFKNEVPECGSREDALNHRERIAEEKRFYDGLSEKEKRQLSHDYVDRLNRYSEWIAGCTYETGEGVSVERGGLVVSGDELENAGSVSFKLEVTATEGHSASTDGVHDRDDYIYHDIHHKAGKHEVLQYYDICLYKDVDGTQTQITSVQKDTDAMGKLRITMDIPEEYRGRRHYTIVHEHEGQVVTLTDLDDDPNTVTFEVDRFSTFVLTATDESLAVGAGELGFAGASLTLQHNLTINFKADSALFTEDGYTDPYVVFDFGGVQTTVSSYTLSQDGSRYVFPFRNIAPNQIGQTVTATLYATLNGQLYESQPATYSVTDYCYRMLDTYSAANDPENAYAELRTLLVDLLNYGTLSQQYTGYNTDALANAQLTADQLAWGTGGDPQLSDILNREYTTVDSPTVTWKGAGLSLRDSVAVRLKFAAASTENLTVRMVVGEAEYTLDASQFVATDTEGVYYVYFNQLGAHQMREELYFTVYENETPVSNTLRYSIESYICKQQTSTQAYLAELVMAIIRYGDSAYAYIN